MALAVSCSNELCKTKGGDNKVIWLFRSLCNATRGKAKLSHDHNKPSWRPACPTVICLLHMQQERTL
jgi:hypothetical protein